MSRADTSSWAATAENVRRASSCSSPWAAPAQSRNRATSAPDASNGGAWSLRAFASRLGGGPAACFACGAPGLACGAWAGWQATSASTPASTAAAAVDVHDSARMVGIPSAVVTQQRWPQSTDGPDNRMSHREGEEARRLRAYHLEEQCT